MSASRRRGRPDNGVLASLALAALVYAGVLASAFHFSPTACTGGIERYSLSAAVATIIATGLPILLCGQLGRGWRILLAVALGLGAGVAWVLGFGLARFQVLCQLW